MSDRKSIPSAVLVDLDDTILDDSSLVDECWREACAEHVDRLAPFTTQAVLDGVQKTSRWYWSDPERHRTGRLALDAARREVVRLALLEMGIIDSDLAAAIGDTYSHHRDVGMEPLPDAIETVRWLRESGRRLALLTNGGGPAQRRKIARFGLADLFDAILVEGEVGFGKPDERIYRLALEQLEVPAEEAWMIGDHLEWDVAAPQKLGILGVWIDRRGQGLPVASAIRPDRIVASLTELRDIVRAHA